MSLVFPTQPCLRLFLYPTFGVGGDIRFPLVPYLDTYMSLESYVNNSTLTAGLQPRFRPFSFFRLQLTPTPLLSLHLPLPLNQSKTLRLGGFLRQPWHKRNVEPVIEVQHTFSIWGFLRLKQWKKGEKEKFRRILDEVDERRAINQLDHRLRTFKDGMPRSMGLRGRELRNEDEKYIGGRLEEEGEEAWDDGLPVGERLKGIMREKRREMAERRGLTLEQLQKIRSNKGNELGRSINEGSKGINRDTGKKEDASQDLQSNELSKMGSLGNTEHLLDREAWDNGLPVGKRLKEIMKEKREERGKTGFVGSSWVSRPRVYLGGVFGGDET